MVEKNFFNKRLLVLSIIGSLIPGTWFTAYRTDIDFYVVKILVITTLTVYFFAFIFSLLIKIFSKKNIFNIFSSTLLFSLIFFSFYHFDWLVKSILKENFLKEQTEISLILTFIIGLIFFNFSFKNNEIFIRFITILLPLLLIINLINSIFSKKLDKIFEYPIFSKKEILTDEQIKKINNIAIKENIYYISLDGAVPIKFFNNYISKIDVKDFNETMSIYNFKTIENINSSYFRQVIDLDSIALSEIFNLNTFENAKKFYEIAEIYPIIKTKDFFLKKCKLHMCDNNGKRLNLTDFYARNLISSKATFPTILKNTNITPLGKILKKINYDLVWIGSKDSNCIFFDQQLCSKNKKSFIYKIVSYFDFNDMYKSNYVLRNYLHQTPLIKINYKLNEIGFRVEKNLEKASIQIDSIQRFIKTSELKKNRFTFIHFGMPKINYVNNNVPIVFNNDCSRKKLNQRIDFLKLGNEKLQYFNIESYKDLYISNYICMIKRIKEFAKFINVKDPNSFVVIQAGYNVPIFNNETERDNYNIFTLSNLGNKCKEKIENVPNQVESIKLLIKCSISQAG